jgi:hypothetical protein
MTRAYPLLVVLALLVGGCGSTEAKQEQFSPLTPAAVERAAAKVRVCLGFRIDSSHGRKLKCNRGSGSVAWEGFPRRCPTAYIEGDVGVLVCGRRSDARAEARTLIHSRDDWGQVVIVKNVVVFGPSASPGATLVRALRAD